MRLASALGDDDGVIRAYQRCERALAEIGTDPRADDPPAARAAPALTPDAAAGASTGAKLPGLQGIS